jgi:hypothetical protein
MSQNEWEQPHIVESMQMVCVFVGVQDRVDQANSFTKQLIP